MDRTLIKIIDALERRRKDFAVGALTHPKTERDVPFEYGRACGYMQGLSEALQIIHQQLKLEEADRDQ